MEWSKRSTGRKSHSLRQQNEGHQLHRSAFLNEWMTLFRSKNWSNIEKTNKTKSKKKQVEVHPLLTFPLLPHILFQQKGIGWISVSCAFMSFTSDLIRLRVRWQRFITRNVSPAKPLFYNGTCVGCVLHSSLHVAFFFFLNVFNVTAPGGVAPHFPLFTYEGWACMQLTFTDITGCFSPKRALSLAFRSDHTSSNESLCDRPLTEWKQWAWLSQKSKNTLSNTLQAHWLIHGIVFLVNLYKTRSRI